MSKELSMVWVKYCALCCVICVLLFAAAASRAVASQGYVPRPCGFDMNRNGTAGEAADCHVCDGKTTDVDGNGVTDVLKYVDCQNGNDSSGNGSPSSPYKTIQKAMNSLPKPLANQIEAVCFKGTCSETITPTKSGAAGTYTRAKSGSEAIDFLYPRYPVILSGWDANGNGDYPPHDTADTAVLDGSLSNLVLAIDNFTGSHSNLEFAHFAARKYDLSCADGGFMKVYGTGGSPAEIYVHDLDLSDVLSGCGDGANRIVFNLFNGNVPLTYFAVENVNMQRYASYFARGIGPGYAGTTAYTGATAGPWRFKNLTLEAQPIANGTVAGFKLWNYINGVEILDSIVDANLGAWTCSGCQGNSFSITVAQCSQGWTIRNNILINWTQGLMVQPDAGSTFCESRMIDGVVFDRNTIQITTNPWPYGHFGVQIQSGPTVATTVGNVSLTNNVITSSVGYSGCIWSNVGNNGGTNPGTATIVGNTCSGAATQWYQLSIGDFTGSGPTFPQQNYVVKNNVITGGGTNVWTRYAPTNLSLDGNKYSPTGNFVWAAGSGTNFATWKTNSHEGSSSAACSPTFVSASTGNLHLASTDTCAKDAGVNVSTISTTDIDAQTRPYGPGWDSGADEYVPSGALAAPSLISVVPVGG